MKKIYIPCIISSFLFCSEEMFSQNIAINTDGSAAEAGVMLDLKGTNTEATTATQTVFQIKSFDANALKLRMILGTNAVAASRYGAIDVYDAGTASYRILSLVPSGGNVGIGTTSPIAMLDVKGSGNTLATFGLGVRNSSNTYALAVRDDGNVGIGTVAPGNKLQITGAGGGTVDLLVNGRMQTGDAGGGGGIFLSDATNMFVGQNGTNVGFWTAGAGVGWNAFQVTQAGYVGIGTTAPSEQLEVVTASGAGGIMITCQPDAHLDSRSLTTGKNFDLIGTYMGWDQNAIYIGGYNSWNSGRSANKVFCGGPAADLDLYAKIFFANGDIQLVTNLNYAPTSGGVHNGVPWDALRDDGANNVLWIVPWNGQYSSVRVGNDGTNIGGPPVNLIDVHGDVQTQDCGASLNALWGCSDRRYKKDIVPMKGVLPDLMKLQGVKYNWRKDEFPNMEFFNDRRQIGFIAQEMEKIFPEIVNTNEKGYKSIEYAKLTPVLVEAIKELKTENDSLKIEILNLKASYDTRLKALEQIVGTKAEK